jgi:hypothetical protein
MLHLEPVDLLGPVPAELFERFEHGEASRLDAALNDALAAFVVFALDQTAQVFEMVPVLLSGLLRQFEVIRGFIAISLRIYTKWQL